MAALYAPNPNYPNISFGPFPTSPRPKLFDPSTLSCAGNRRSRRTLVLARQTFLMFAQPKQHVGERGGADDPKV